MQDWREEYKRKLISAEEAAGLVKSGDSVGFTVGREARSIGLTIAARKEELRDVKVAMPSPGHDFGWYDPGWEESFAVTIFMPTAVGQDMVDERRCDLAFGTVIPFVKDSEERFDILLTEVSSPDERGFCSFGASVWNKRREINDAKLTIAEVNKNLIRTFGENYVHVSEIDYFVEHVASGGVPGMGTLAGRMPKEPEPYLKNIAEYVSELIKDRDTIQIGVGRTTEPLVRLGMFDGKHDLGFFSEATPPGVISLVKEGVINGKYKNLHPGKVVVTSIGGSTREEMEWVSDNPLFLLVDITYLEDIRVIAAHDNMVAINNALAVDLMGQVAAENLGTRVLSVAGGQIPFVMGTWLSKGGCSVTVLPSTAQGGTVSRIMPTLPPGTAERIVSSMLAIVLLLFANGRALAHYARRRPATAL